MRMAERVSEGRRIPSVVSVPFPYSKRMERDCGHRLFKMEESKTLMCLPPSFCHRKQRPKEENSLVLGCTTSWW